MILCCGEALIDMIPAATVDGPEGFVPHCGGAVYNTAIALGRLGVRTGLLTGLSTDLFGQQLRAGLAASHVDTAHVISSDRPTTLAFLQLLDGHARYIFHDENSAGRMLTPAEMPDLGDEVTALFFGGISLACEPGAEAYAALLARSGTARAVMLDPNIRPDFIADPARYRQRLDRMLGQADLVKLSDEDLDWLIPGPAPLPDKARAVLAKGPSALVVTRGGDGASGFLSDGSDLHVPAERAVVRDTVGAGDSFNAGVLARLSELGVLSKPGLAGLTPARFTSALQAGARVAAITVSRAGANPPWAAELRPAPGAGPTP